MERPKMAELESLETAAEHERILREIESTDTACIGPTLRIMDLVSGMFDRSGNPGMVGVVDDPVPATSHPPRGSSLALDTVRDPGGSHSKSGNSSPARNSWLLSWG
ncbi:hypothetical protein TURU_152690 [Turdus rufiventris]|nr:hypothetical protein TURU_152690 [Turdus rufiventris]